MSVQRWFPINYALPDGQKLRKLIGARDNWQLYGAVRTARILVSTPELAERWMSEGLLDASSLTEVRFGKSRFLLIWSGDNQQLGRRDRVYLARDQG